MSQNKLHIICGSCGSNTFLSFRIEPDGHDVSVSETKLEPAVFITCGNCGTVHDLIDTVTEVKE